MMDSLFVAFADSADRVRRRFLGLGGHDSRGVANDRGDKTHGERIHGDELSGFANHHGIEAEEVSRPG